MTGWGGLDMTTVRDRDQEKTGYWPAPWPGECGGNRRQAAAGKLGAVAGGPGNRPPQRSLERHGGRARAEWFLGGTMAAFSGPPPFGWAERIDRVWRRLLLRLNCPR